MVDYTKATSLLVMQDLPVVEPEHMLSAGLWEDIALPALKKVAVLINFERFQQIWSVQYILSS